MLVFSLLDKVGSSLVKVTFSSVSRIMSSSVNHKVKNTNKQLQTTIITYNSQSPQLSSTATYNSQNPPLSSSTALNTFSESVTPNQANTKDKVSMLLIATSVLSAVILILSIAVIFILVTILVIKRRHNRRKEAYLNSNGASRSQMVNSIKKQDGNVLNPSYGGGTLITLTFVHDIVVHDLLLFITIILSCRTIGLRTSDAHQRS